MPTSTGADIEVVLPVTTLQPGKVVVLTPRAVPIVDGLLADIDVSDVFIHVVRPDWLKSCVCRAVCGLTLRCTLMEDTGDCVAPVPIEGEVKPDWDGAAKDEHATEVLGIPLVR
jgi:hypothetical protein